MAKGSQLTQLKSALSQAGVTHQPQNGQKKRKRAGYVDHDKEKKAAKLNEIHQKLNPFDVKVTKLKHDVGGRKLKGVTGRPAKSKQAGLEQVRTYLFWPMDIHRALHTAEENFAKRVRREESRGRDCRSQVW
jgi:hypothetical protein